MYFAGIGSSSTATTTAAGNGNGLSDRGSCGRGGSIVAIVEWR